MVRAIVERLPVLVCPRWVSVAAQPIGIEDLIAYLVAALDLGEDGNRTFEIGGTSGWYFGNSLWRIRSFLDRLARGGIGMRRGRRDPEDLRVCDPLDCWRHAPPWGRIGELDDVAASIASLLDPSNQLDHGAGARRGRRAGGAQSIPRALGWGECLLRGNGRGLPMRAAGQERLPRRQAFPLPERSASTDAPYVGIMDGARPAARDNATRTIHFRRGSQTVRRRP
jgi:hypothetical protein